MGSNVRMARLHSRCSATSLRPSLPRSCWRTWMGLVQPQRARDFGQIMSVLHGIPDERGNPLYRVVYKVVDPTDVGIPQSRPRLFIVGISAGVERKSKRFTFPGKGQCEVRPLAISLLMVLPTLPSFRAVIRSRRITWLPTKRSFLPVHPPACPQQMIGSSTWLAGG